MDRHVIEALGRARITVENGKVVDVGEPMIEYCPLFDKHRGIKELTKEEIEKNIQFRIDDFGMCTKNRQLRLKDFLSFGISEILSTLLDENLIDCAVMVCEGCGTVLVTESEMAQGVGGRVSGLVETSPISQSFIWKSFGQDRVVDSETARIDQVDGLRLAIDNGYKNIAVTICLAEDGIILRELEKEYEDINVYIFAVHSTGLGREEAEIIFDTADVVTGCASKHLRDIGKELKVFSVGTSIPIFAASDKGEEFIKLRLDKIGGPKKKTGNSKQPNPLV
ncbi:methanogenesis marker protein 8 [Methanobrevibacter ruminantium M1]|uniref:Methanogenesis marker protein 8 n=1 Tax=Methanobrevibacter ruminantium (strain ATCC 35063 / DSM 1093 / JCM 13430 / OCM 146 / M1) TaxID=634498 RepID=D3E0P1_METRM|nr:methanogenesis marker 8 protein [Methanobrevibacter ruminantium]ADC46287.1 methanogenesis marker protein 8 [Methanobrevibacter ruminantium M1]